MLQVGPVALSEVKKNPHNDASAALDELLNEGGVSTDTETEAPESNASSDLEKALKDLLAMNKNDEPTATPETMRDFIKKYLGEDQSEENKKLILETILKDKDWNWASSKPLKTFMEELSKLPKDAQEKTLSVLNKIDSSVLLKAIESIPKHLQHPIVERGFKDHKNGKSIQALEKAVIKSHFTLTAAQAQLLINEGSSHPVIFDQFFKVVPDAKNQIFSWLKDTGGAAERQGQLQSFVLSLEEGKLSLTPKDSTTLASIVRDTNLNKDNRRHAFRALEISDKEQSQTLFEELSTSIQGSDRLFSAALLDGTDSRRVDILTGAISLATPEQLLEIDKELPSNTELNLKGSVADLKTIFEKGNQLNDGFGVDLMVASLKALGKTAKAEELLPFLQKALKDVQVTKENLVSTNLYLAAIDTINARPKEEQESYRGIVKKVFNDFMTSMNSDQLDSLSALAFEHSVSLLEKHPDLLKAHSAEITKSLRDGTTRFPWANLTLLSGLREPSLIPLFASQLKKPDLGFDASLALGNVLKAYPDKADESLKTQLTDILAAHDKHDELRLYLRQNLPEPLRKELDNRVFKAQSERRPVGLAERATVATATLAEQVLADPKSPIGQTALALRTLLTNPRGNQEELGPKLETFLKQIVGHSSGSNEEALDLTLAETETNPATTKKAKAFSAGARVGARGIGWNIHDGIQLNELITLAESKGIAIDPALIQQARALTNQQFNRVWNAGNPVVSFSDGNSNLTTYAQSAMVLSLRQDQIPEVARGALKNLERRRVEDAESVRFSYDFNNRIPTASAESSGRAVTAQLALYQQAPAESRPQEAKRLLKTLTRFEENFSQLFELPLQTQRTHNRHPQGQHMAAYYGFGNAPYAADAIRRLASDASLSPEQRDQVYRISERLEGRLLNLMNQDGLLYPIQNENFAYERASYNFLTDLTLKSLRGVQRSRPTKAPQTRLLGSVEP